MPNFRLRVIGMADQGMADHEMRNASEDEDTILDELEDSVLDEETGLKERFTHRVISKSIAENEPKTIE